ncbi:T9SS type A sorting domain-containing protein [Hymenobacter sp. BT683]|uniref:T9SS type A sorting domain-containing protein n=1 Tax=Hymenobacter jeongseonensis TaxID=2791027 RepID=A0ABS0IDI0_9BACT|nr:T9SS type A sorting domain-containing protein [Hymenobacter jeongseonensis]MBF9236104.1 T9SS type A sorting domain-containing protein [Hymenobacter jeongseonensis]
MFIAPASLLLSAGRHLAWPLPLLVLLASPAALAQAPAEPLAELSVYPNPAHIRATVQVPAVAGATSATVTLIDSQGTVVFEQPVSLLETGGAAEVPLLGKAPGLYRVQVKVGDLRTARTLKVE